MDYGSNHVPLIAEKWLFRTLYISENVEKGIEQFLLKKWLLKYVKVIQKISNGIWTNVASN